MHLLKDAANIPILYYSRVLFNRLDAALKAHLHRRFLRRILSGDFCGNKSPVYKTSGDFMAICYSQTEKNRQ